ncbi:MAG: DNA translocase FtsK [Nitrospirota bacterium]
MDTKRTNEIIGISLIAAALLIGVSIISYHPADPSLTTVSSTSEVLNLSGKVGAIISDLFFQLIGGSAYILPLMLLILGIKRLFILKDNTLIPRIIGILVLLISSSILTDIYFDNIFIFSGGYILSGKAGGMTGKILSPLLREYLGNIGTQIIMIFIFTLSIMMTTSISMIDIIKGLGEIISRGMIVVLRRIGSYISISRERKKRARSSLNIVRRAKSRQEKPKIVDSKRDLSITPVQDTFEFMKEGEYQLPPLSLLHSPNPAKKSTTEEELIINSRILEKKLLDFGVEGRVLQVHPGPVITMYEFEPASGIKINRIVNLSDDLALAMKAMSVRIVAPIPGKSVVGIEIANNIREEVFLKEILASDNFKERKSDLSVALGKDIFGVPVIIDIAKMPHLLVAGATGSGKSVALNSMICSILFSAVPSKVKMLMIDPKMLELSLYVNIPHLIMPVVTRPKDSSKALRKIVVEMENRYQILSEVGVRNIEGYNKFVDSQNSGKKPAAGEGDNDPITREKLPYIIVIIDELADLMMTAPKDIEDCIARLAQMARASGIYLLIATQRPSVDVLTGVIKANFPARISFQVSSKTDSRTILDANGAEQLLGKGDMLFMSPVTGRIMRVHGSYISEAEINRTVDFIKSQAKPEYDIFNKIEEIEKTNSISDERDALYEKAIDVVTSTGQASASFIQRRLRVGYPRAARMIEMMEEDGIIGPPAAGRQREIFIERFRKGIKD